MSLRYFYASPADLLNKIERECYRTIHAGAETRKEAMCDHFFNFCVTAHALRDWVKKSPNFPAGLDIHKKCNGYPELAACRDIANSNKHFDFESTRFARGAVISRSSVADVFEDKHGALHITDPRESIEISIAIDGEPIQDSYQFMQRVINIWSGFLNEFDIPFESIFGRNID
jgi:hypothetical protein